MIPAWIMSIKATKLLRISWRFLLQAIMIIPFVLYERRKADAQTLEKYKLSYIFNFEHLYIAYLSSFATSFWFTIILTTFEWSFISHTMFLGALANYFLSIGRTMRGNGHDLEPGGQVLITIGILMVLIDIYQFNPQHDAKPEDWHFINPWYLTRSRIESVLADLVNFSPNTDSSRSLLLHVQILSLHRRSQKPLSPISIHVAGQLYGVHKYDVYHLFLQWCHI